MMKANYRMARADDVDVAAEFVEYSADGLADLLLKDLIPDTTPLELLKYIINDENSPLHFSNIILGEVDFEVIAAANIYDSKQHGIPEFMLTLLPDSRVKVIQNFLQSRVENSLYIHTIAIKPEFRGQKISYELMECFKSIASASDLSSLSAHVWEDNLIAQEMFRQFGFVPVEKVTMGQHKLLNHDCDMILFKNDKLN